VRCSRAVSAEAVGPVSGGAGLLLVRPAAVRVCEPGSASCHVAGSVTDVAFRGRGYELAVELQGGGRVTNVVTSERMARGETVGLQFGPGGCVVFADNDVAPSPQGVHDEPAEIPSTAVLPARSLRATFARRS